MLISHVPIGCFSDYHGLQQVMSVSKFLLCQNTMHLADKLHSMQQVAWCKPYCAECTSTQLQSSLQEAADAPVSLICACSAAESAV